MENRLTTVISFTWESNLHLFSAISPPWDFFLRHLLPFVRWLLTRAPPTLVSNKCWSHLLTLKNQWHDWWLLHYYFYYWLRLLLLIEYHNYYYHYYYYHYCYYSYYYLNFTEPMTWLMTCGRAAAHADPIFLPISPPSPSLLRLFQAFITFSKKTIPSNVQSQSCLL